MGTMVQVGTIVHVIRQERCYAAMVLRVDEEGVWVRPFTAADERVLREGYEPEVSLQSARPTSGWHHINEHDVESSDGD